MEHNATQWYYATGCDTMDDEGISYFVACNDAKQYVARINDATCDVEKTARIDAFRNHVNECATCRNDATLHTDADGTPL